MSLSFFCIKLNGFKYCYQVMLSLRARVDLGPMKMRDSTFPKSSNWSLTIRWFNVISRALIGRGVLPLRRDAFGVFYSPKQLCYWSGSTC